MFELTKRNAIILYLVAGVLAVVVLQLVAGLPTRIGLAGAILSAVLAPDAAVRLGLARPASKAQPSAAGEPELTTAHLEQLAAAQRDAGQPGG